MRVQPKVLFVSGWGYGASCYEDVFGRDLVAYTFSRWLSLTEKDRERIFGMHERLLLVGWSLGAYLLASYSSLPSVVGMLWVGAGRTFCHCSVGPYKNPYGVERDVLIRMRKNLLDERKRDRVMESFYEDAVYPEKRRMFYAEEGRFTPAELIEGLKCLEKAFIKGSNREGKKVLVWHGREDKIVSWQSARLLAEAYGCAFHLEEEAGHLLMRSHACRLRDLLRMLS